MFFLLKSSHFFFLLASEFQNQGFLEDSSKFRGFDLNFIFFIHILSTFLLNFFSYLYILLRIYKIFCYAKLTFEWFPMINPYEWPFSFFQAITKPYFNFWKKNLPAIKFKTTSINVSAIVGLEALNAIIYFCVRFVNYLIVLLENSETVLQILQKNPL